MNILGNVIFYVDDVEKTVLFYEDAFGIQRAFIDPSGHYAQMQTGTTALGFASKALARQNLSQEFSSFTPDKLPGMEISFTAGDLHRSITKAISAGAELIASPEEKPWGQTIAYVRDFNGILIEICSEMDACHDEECSSCGSD